MLTSLAVFHQPLFATGADSLLKNKFHFIADSLFNNKKYNEAFYNYEKAARIYHSDKEWEQEVTCLNGAGNSLQKNREYDRSIEIFNKSLDLGLIHLDENNEYLARTFHLKCRSYMWKGDYYKAGFSEQEAIKRWEIIYGKQSHDVAKGYNILGVCNKNTGNYNKSLEYYKKALKICEIVLDSLHPDIASIMNNISFVYKEKGDYDQALKYSEKAINITLKNTPVDSVLLVKKYNNLGLMYLNKGNSSLAQEYHKKALDLRLKNLEKNHPDIAESYNNLGMINRIEGNYNEALCYYNKALEIYSGIYKEKHPDIAMCYNNIGNIYKEKQDFDKALYYYSKTLNIRTEIYREYHPEIATCYLNYGNINKIMENYNKALSYLEKALIANTYDGKILSDGKQLSILSEKASVFISRYEKISNDTTDLINAISVYKNISVLVDDLRKSYKSKGSMLVLSNSVSEVYKEAVKISYKIYEITKNKYYIDEAFYFAEKNKANVLVEAIMESRSQTFSGILDSLMQQEKELKSRLRKCDQKRQAEIFHKGKRNKERIKTLEKEFSSLNLSYDSLIKVFEKNYKNYFLLKYNTSILSSAEAQKALSPGTAIIEYVEADSLLFIITITKKNLSITKVSVDSLDHLVYELRNTLSHLSVNTINSSTSQMYCKLAYRLFNILLQPVEERISDQDLIIIPDGKLGYIPFEVLLTERIYDSILDFRNLPYLIKKYPINYGNSVTIHLELLNTLKCHAKNNFFGIAPFTETETSEDYIFNHDTLKLSKLPSSRQEVESIKKLIGGKIYEGIQATRQNFLQEVKDYKILHIATHGFVDDKKPLESCLFFYPEASPNANVLKIYDLFNLNFGSEMAVLSACNTGIGKLENGEGIMSLARGFSYAGVPGVAMSLWNVNDKSTSEIMQNFYNYLKKGYLRNEALRLAKLDYIEQSDKIFATPYYWGGFVYIGKNDVIDFSNDTSNYWYLLLVFPILSIVFFFYKRKNQ
ncbi:MAG: CHAT domain-containing protein [Bacteroidales bacterium]|nr:CHAT domain-containing protein [Bacteroidales bacterium]